MTRANIEHRNMWQITSNAASRPVCVWDWCRLNHVSRPCLYRWLAKFRDEGPGRFPCRNAATMDWLEIASYGLADAKGIVPYRMNRGHADHTFPTFLVDISRQQPR